MSESRTIPITGNGDLVTFTLAVNGEALPRSVNILSVTVTNEVNRIPAAVLQVLDGEAAASDFKVSNEDWFAPGSEIEILAGYNSQEESIFSGIVIKQSVKIRTGASLLIVECRDKAVKLTIDKMSRYFEEVKDSDAIEEIITARGLDAAIDATTEAHKELVQYNCTDWDFIQTRAEANSLLCFTESGTVAVKKPDLTASPVLELLYGSTILDFDAEMDARFQYSAVETAAWDSSGQELVTAGAEDPGVTEVGNIPADELAAVLNTAACKLQHSGGLSEPQLQEWANGSLLKSRLAKIRGRAKFTGTSLVKPGVAVTVSGVGDRFSGDVFITATRHEIANGSWTTQVQFGLSPRWFAEEHPDVNAAAAAALLPAIKGLHIGLVTDLEDPDGANRVKVKMPTISMDDEGTWARVVSPDAGNNRGVFFRPEVDDEVIVGFLNEDPRYAVVLGLLYSAAKPAPLTQDNANNQKGIITRSEIKMVFDDEKKSFALQTPAGKKITLDDEAGTVEIADENNNKITMSSSGIVIESAAALELKAATDLKISGAQITVNADAACTVKSGATMEVSASGNTTIKGAMVMIN